MVHGGDIAGADVASIRRKALSGMKTVLARGVLVRLLGLIASIVLARLLTPSDFGTLAFGLSLIAIGTALGESGLAAGFIRGTAPPSRQQLAAALGLQLAATSLLVLPTTVVLLASGDVGARVTGVMILALIPVAFRVPAVVQLERELSYRAVARAEVAEALTFNGLAVILVIAGAGVWGVALAAVVKPIVGAAILQATSPRRVLLPSRRWGALSPVLRFSLAFQASNVLILIRDQGAIVLTAIVGGTAILGLWTLAQRIMLPVFLLYESMWRVSFPSLSQLIRAGHDPRADVERGLSVAAIVSGLLLVPLAAGAPILVPAVFGSNWSDVSPVVALAASSLVFAGPIAAVSAGYFSAIGRMKLLILPQMATATLWLIALPALIPRFGVLAHGIVWATANAIDAIWLGGVLRAIAGVRVVRALVLPASLASAIALVGYSIADATPPRVAIGLAVATGSLLAFLGVTAMAAPAGLRALVRLRGSRASHGVASTEEDAVTGEPRA